MDKDKIQGPHRHPVNPGSKIMSKVFKDRQTDKKRGMTMDPIEKIWDKINIHCVHFQKVIKNNKTIKTMFLDTNQSIDGVNVTQIT